ncbi:hypothetical protein KC19_1G113900 [Ceratodon purpureus]|uniref:Uncharacterized protein n=1 Tax=Ceratodon purpureus TaxID=3225 RepID=A0A8T0J739_CERPU|nr:hypothetical protein KC19_1G113900 [Ceratodon purpureus]
MGRDKISDVSAACRKLTMDTPDEGLIGVWIWEFMLRVTSDLSVANALSEAIPYPKGVPRLKHMAVVRELANQVSKDLDIQQILDCLEALKNSFVEEPVDEAEVNLEDAVLPKRLKLSSSVSSKRNAKVRGLHERKASESIHNAGEESIWNRLQQPVLELKEELQELLQRSAIVNEDAQYAKVKARLSALIEDAWALFGPTFIERVEAAVISGKYKPLGVSFAPLLQNVAGIAGDNGANPINGDVPEGAEQALDECCDELQKNVSGSNKELERAHQAFTESTVDIEKLFNDPLPALVRKPGEKRKTAEPAAQRRLLDPHPSAQAEVWGDDEGQERRSPRSPSESRRIKLPPIASPTPRILITESSCSGVKIRRRTKKWTDEEVEIFKRELIKHGRGNWKTILRHNRDVFNGRTEVDMKDKCRNLVRSGVLPRE